MSSYLLDTTALLAHFRQETGAERVQTLLDDEAADMYICSISITEFARRLVSLGSEIDEARSIALEYAGLATSVIPVDTSLAVRAFELGSVCSERLPLADALIASAASSHNATLLHRDAHFDALPTALLEQEILN